MDKKSLKEKQLDRNCRVVTSSAFSEVSMNKQKNQRNISAKLHAFSSVHSKCHKI